MDKDFLKWLTKGVRLGRIVALVLGVLLGALLEREGQVPGALDALLKELSYSSSSPPAPSSGTPPR